jgi:hypothetical protein
MSHPIAVCSFKQEIKLFSGKTVKEKGKVPMLD